MRRIGQKGDGACNSVICLNRPSLPPLFICALIFWAICALNYKLLSFASVELCLFAALAGLVCVIAVSAFLRNINACPLSVILGICLGVTIAGFYSALMYLNADTADESSAKTDGALICIEDSKTGSYGSSCKAIMLNGVLAGSVVRMEVHDEVEISDRIPRCGDIIVGQMNIEAPAEREREYCWSNGIAVTASITKYSYKELPLPFSLFFLARNAAIDEMCEIVNGETIENTWLKDGIRVLAALVCGYRGMLSDGDLYENYKIAGLAHLIAVSGAHLSLVSSLVAQTIQGLRIPRRYGIGIQVALLSIYVIFSGMPISALRACVMAFCCHLSTYAKRRPASINALGFCILAIIAVFPPSSISPSFVLSAGSTMGIILFSPLLSGILRNIFPGLSRYITESMSLTLSAGLCTQLYSAALFSQLSIISPLSNILVAPIFSVACSVGLVLVAISVLIPIFSCVLISVAGIFCAAINLLVSFLSSIPFACIPADISMYLALGITLLTCLALWLIWPFPSRRDFAAVSIPPLAITVILACLLTISSHDELIVLDVGQGDAIVVRSKGKTMMIDTGTEDGMLKEALARNNIFSIDTLFITHPDDDHCGSIEALASVCKIGKVVVPLDCLNCCDDSCVLLIEAASNAVGKSSISGVLPGDIISCGSFSLTVVWPDEYRDDGGNGDSLCLSVSRDCDQDGIYDSNMLLCGDAESEVIDTLVRQKRIGHIDVLKVGHHGSKASLSTDNISALSPEIALVSVGESNRYGHPSQTIIDILESHGSTVFRTDLQGDLRCSFSSDSIKVSTLR